MNPDNAKVLVIVLSVLPVALVPLWLLDRSERKKREAMEREADREWEEAVLHSKALHGAMLKKLGKVADSMSGPCLTCGGREWTANRAHYQTTYWRKERLLQMSPVLPFTCTGCGAVRHFDGCHLGIVDPETRTFKEEA